MYDHIMVPVDLRHPQSMDKPLAIAADLAGHWGAEIHLVSVTGTATSEVAHDPEEFAAKLRQFAADAGARHGATFRARAELTADPAVDLDVALRHAIRELGADLVVMASHVPSLWDYLSASNAGHLASHAEVSVFVVR